MSEILSREEFKERRAFVAEYLHHESIEPQLVRTVEALAEALRVVVENLDEHGVIEGFDDEEQGDNWESDYATLQEKGWIP